MNKTIGEMGHLVLKAMLVMVGLLLLLSILPSFLPSGPVLAQEVLEERGGVARGYSDRIPIQLKDGEMVEGEMIAERDPLRLSIDDFSGKTIHDFGIGPRGGFYYVAETEGQHYLVVTNPDAFSAGTRGYTLKYEITATDLPPGARTGENTSRDIRKLAISWSVIW